MIKYNLNLTVHKSVIRESGYPSKYLAIVHY